MNPFDESIEKINACNKAIEDNNFRAQLQGRKHHDDADAASVQALRDLGRKIGQEKAYEKRIAKLLKERGY